MVTVRNPRASTPWSLGYDSIRPRYVRTYVAVGHEAPPGEWPPMHLPVTLDGVVP